MWMSCPPNVGPFDEWIYMEFALLLLLRPVWGSLTGAHPGLFTSENKKALESYWYRPDDNARRRKVKKDVENKLVTMS